MQGWERTVRTENQTFHLFKGKWKEFTKYRFIAIGNAKNLRFHQKLNFEVVVRAICRRDRSRSFNSKLFIAAFSQIYLSGNWHYYILLMFVLLFIKYTKAIERKPVSLQYEGCSESSWNLVIRFSNINIILSFYDISQVGIYELASCS